MIAKCISLRAKRFPVWNRYCEIGKPYEVVEQDTKDNTLYISVENKKFWVESECFEIITEQNNSNRRNMRVIVDESLRKINYPVGFIMKDTVYCGKLLGKIINGVYQNETIVLWCRGSSGAILAAIAAAEIVEESRVSICHVKKPGEDSHSTGIITSNQEQINIFIDDFIAEGETMLAIYSRFKEITGAYHVPTKVHAIAICGEYNSLIAEVCKPGIFICNKITTNKIKQHEKINFQS